MTFIQCTFVNVHVHVWISWALDSLIGMVCLVINTLEFVHVHQPTFIQCTFVHVNVHVHVWISWALDSLIGMKYCNQIVCLVINTLEFVHTNHTSELVQVLCMLCIHMYVLYIHCTCIYVRTKLMVYPLRNSCPWVCHGYIQYLPRRHFMLGLKLGTLALLVCLGIGWINPCWYNIVSSWQTAA